MSTIYNGYERSNMNKKYQRFFFTSLKVFLVGLFILMVIATFAQVFFRYVLNNPLFGAEEVARLLCVWLTFVGAGVAIAARGHISIDILVDRLHGKRKEVANLVAYGLIVVFDAIIISEGIRLTMFTIRLESSALRFSMSLFFLPVPICGIIMMIYLVRSIRETCTNLLRRRNE